MAMRIGIAAAGTGGHVFPALAVADELTARGLAKDDIVFFGGDRIEARLVPDAGYPFVGVDIHGLRRSLSVDNLRLPGKVRAARDVITSTIESRGLAAMIVFGGYIAGPAALAARRAHIPLIVHEANAVPGLANRMIARRADAVYVAFAPTASVLRGATVIGSPLRSEIAGFDRDLLRGDARRRYGLDDDVTVLGVVGGSLGAAFLNDVATILGEDATRSYQILHVTGPDHHTRISARAEAAGGWVTVPFEDHMIDLYAAVDLVLCRGGAMTMSEIQATATPAVVVPLPAGRGYQAGNAADVVGSGGAILVPQGDVEEVASAVRALVDDPERLRAMRTSVPSVDHRRAASIIADRVMGVTHA